MFIALDSSTLTLSLALFEGGPGRGSPTLIEHEVRGPPTKQSELLPGAVDAILARHGLKLSALRGIVVGLGPGSFTGLRIGIAAAKALGYALEVPVVGVSSLAALALDAALLSRTATAAQVVVPLAVARVNDLYFGQYCVEGATVRRLVPESADAPAQVAQLLRDTPGAVAVGPALADYGEKLLALGVPPERLREAPAYPSAVALGQLVEWPAAFDLQALFALEPHYVRPSEAERNPKFPPAPGWSPTARLKED